MNKDVNGQFHPNSLVELSEDRCEVMRMIAEKRLLEARVRALESCFTIIEADGGITVEVDTIRAAGLLLGPGIIVAANDEESAG